MGKKKVIYFSLCCFFSFSFKIFAEQPGDLSDVPGFPSLELSETPLRVHAQRQGFALPETTSPNRREDPHPSVLSIPLNPEEEQIDEILKFWFGPLPSPSSFPFNKVPLWEGTDSFLNNELKFKFLKTYSEAGSGHYRSWTDTPKGTLALILLLDLFPRHFYPNQSQMFATDPLALAIAREGIRTGQDRLLFPIERIFFYLPFQQSEDRAIQAESVKLYTQLFQESPPKIKPIIYEFLKLALRHQKTIERFGRFPHRNKLLNRQSTLQELDYLEHSNSSL